MNVFRQLELSELRLLEKLLNHEFSGCDELRQQLAGATARQIDDLGGLELQSSLGGRAEVLSRCPTEGTCPDADGVLIHVSLHVVDGRMNELEIFKEDGSKIQTPPNPDLLTVY